MENTITINSVSSNKASNGREYLKIETDKGNFSIFDEDKIIRLKEAFDNRENVVVDIVTNNKGFKNIEAVGQTVKTVSPSKAFKAETKPNSNAMYVSYAKDLIVSGKTADEAIAIIKQLQEAFS